MKLLHYRASSWRTSSLNNYTTDLLPCQVELLRPAVAVLVSQHNVTVGLADDVRVCATVQDCTGARLFRLALRVVVLARRGDVLVACALQSTRSFRCACRRIHGLQASQPSYQETVRCHRGSVFHDRGAGCRCPWQRRSCPAAAAQTSSSSNQS